MKKIISFLIVLIISVMVTTQVHAQEVAGQSATITIAPTDAPIKLAKKTDYAKKKLAIKRVLERYGSPVAHTADGFIAACKEYDLNCYMLPAILGVESTFGKFHIPGTHNGFGWGRGTIAFDSWEDSYMAVGKGLRENYINKGATDIDSIGAIYCEGNTWSGKVKFFMAQFEAEEAKLDLYFD